MYVTEGFLATQVCDMWGLSQTCCTYVSKRGVICLRELGAEKVYGNGAGKGKGGQGIGEDAGGCLGMCSSECSVEVGYDI